MKKRLLLLLFLADAFFMNGQNVGIGTTTPIATLEVVRGTAPFGTAAFHGTNNISHFNIGITEDTYINGGKAGSHVVLNYAGSGLVGIGTLTPFSPLTFNNNLGEKISLYGNSGNNYGFGITGGTFQIHSDAPGADIAFGYGSSSSFTERMRIKGTGNVGIGTTNPTTKLHVSAGDASLALFGPNAAGGSLYVGASVDPGVVSTALVIATDGNLYLDPAWGKNIHIGRYTAMDIYMNPNGGTVRIGTDFETQQALEVKGSAIVNAYTRLGYEAPSIKMKKLIGTTASTEGESVLIPIPLGLSLSKILSISVLVSPSPSENFPPNVQGFGYNFYWYSIGNSIEVKNVSGQSANILSKTIKILITYEE